MTERTYSLAYGKDFLSPETTPVAFTAAKLVSKLRKFFVISLTQAEYAALPPREKATWKKKSGFVIGGNFSGKKKSSDCSSRSLVTLDLDALTPESSRVCIKTLETLKCHSVIYSTASHTPEKPRLRAFIFLKEDLPPEKYRNVVQFFANLLPAGAVSNESFVVSQIMYLPQRCSDGEEFFLELAGEPFDASNIPDQTPELTERPRTSQAAWDIPGIVGRVAARYEGDFDRAIEELDLPYERSTSGATCGEFEDRYTYTKGQGADGAVWYADDGHLYSHHGSDPCGGINATIFDVLRLHRFNPELDDQLAPINERSSHQRTAEYLERKFPELGAIPVSPDEMDIVVDEPAVPADPTRFRVIRAEDFTDGPPVEELIDGLLPKADLAVVYGASGSGKSFAVFDMVTAIHRGILWRGRETIKSPVIYCCAEAARGFRKRMRAYAKQFGVPMDQMPAVIPEAPDLMQVKDVKDFIAALVAFGPAGVIVIDTLASVMPGGNENESAAMGRVVAHCKAISRATGAIVILVHHSGKDALKGARGWSGLRAACDVELEVVREGEMRVLTLTKSKDDIDGTQFGFRLAIVDVDVDARGKPITSCVIEEADLPVKIANPFTGEKQKMYAPFISELLHSGIENVSIIKDRVAARFADPAAEHNTAGSAPKVREAAWKTILAGVKAGIWHLHDGNTRLSFSPAHSVSPEEFDL